MSDNRDVQAEQENTVDETVQAADAQVDAEAVEGDTLDTINNGSIARPDYMSI
ncbi:MAG: hypothetical protein AAF364_19675 [Pseudomonadota bacterium]